MANPNYWVKQRKRLKHVRFHPAEGLHYKSSRFMLKILILGESHYCWDEMPKRATLTTLAAIKGCDSYPFWKSLARLFPFTSEFWSHVLFYNFVQEFAGDGARKRPTREMWQDHKSVQGFKEILRIYKPERILVVGKDTWRYLPGNTEFPDYPPIPEKRFALPIRFAASLPKSERYAYWYSTGTGQFALAAPIFHPGYPAGFHGKQTKGVVHRLLSTDWEAPEQRG